MSDSTFRDLQVLQAARETVQEKLNGAYIEKVQPFVNIILMIMKAKSLDKFSAMKVIKDELPIYNQENGPLFFSAALMELVEADDFKDFKR